MHKQVSSQQECSVQGQFGGKQSVPTLCQVTHGKFDKCNENSADCCLLYTQAGLPCTGTAELEEQMFEVESYDAVLSATACLMAKRWHCVKDILNILHTLLVLQALNPKP
jgi:hypothetical protein